jgi:cysteine desulfurase
MVPATAAGIVDRDRFSALIGADVGVCSVMWVNNEIGTVQPVPELAEEARAHGVSFHTDAVQAFGKLPINVSELAVDMLTISGHKIGAPKGIGAMFIRRGTPLLPLLHGGSQDRGRRAGTENVAFAVGLARAVELAASERVQECAHLEAMRDRLEAALLARVPDAVVHGRDVPRAPHILHISVPGTDSESMLMALDLSGVACSSGSACQSGNVDPSHVLAAMGVPRDVAVSAVRMSLGSLTTDECIERAHGLSGSRSPAISGRTHR